MTVRAPITLANTDNHEYPKAIIADPLVTFGVYGQENPEILEGKVVDDMPGNEWRRVQHAKSCDHIRVNGEVTLAPEATIDHDEETHNYSGKLLRHGIAWYTALKRLHLRTRHW